MNKKIKDVIFNDLLPSKCDYKFFTVIFDDGKEKKFYYHKNNPVPIKEQILGLTWIELRELVALMFYKSIGKF